MQRFMVAALTAAACLLGSTVANATTALFSISEGGSVIASWRQGLTPTPIFNADGEGTTVAITDATGLIAGEAFINYFNAAFAPGVALTSSSALAGLYDENILDISGIQYFTQTDGAPVFALGIHTGGSDQFSGNPATLTISVPEPATWAITLLGLGMVGMAMRRRRTVNVAFAGMTNRTTIIML